MDAKGEKMSKSKGNVVRPQDVMKTLGADIIRLWVAATDYRGEMRVSDEILKRTADAYRRIRNTARFLLANLNGFDPAENPVAPADMIELDRWAVDRALRLQEEIIEAYRDYQFHLIYQKVHNFCVVDLGGFYLDVIKDRQYTTQADGLPRRSCQTAMYYIAEAMVRWLAPILSFTADEIWGHMPGRRGQTVFRRPGIRGSSPCAAEDAFDRDFWDRVLAARVALGPALEARPQGRPIGSCLDAELDLYCDDDLYRTLTRLGDELRFVTITSEVRLHALAERPDTAAETELPGLAVRVTPSKHPKCVRCWHHRPDVGTHADHPELCGRCVENVAGPARPGASRDETLALALADRGPAGPGHQVAGDDGTRALRGGRDRPQPQSDPDVQPGGGLQLPGRGRRLAALAVRRLRLGHQRGPGGLAGAASPPGAGPGRLPWP